MPQKPETGDDTSTLLEYLFGPGQTRRAHRRPWALHDAGSA
ncbi:hypothetical protein ACN6AT_00535 [Streptomyces sp. JL4002]